MAADKEATALKLSTDYVLLLVIGDAALLKEDRSLIKKETDLLYDEGFLDYIVNRFKKAGKKLNIVDPEYLKQRILSLDGTVVIEKSHGVLTDHYQGFHPHTSAIRTLPRFSEALLHDTNYDGKIINILVHRAFQIRHGAGPMPTADPKMIEKLLPGSHKQENRYQGKIRVGPLDLVLLR